MIWRFVLPVPFYGPRSKHFGKQIPFNSANNYASPIIRRTRTAKHRTLAGGEANKVRTALGLPRLGKSNRYEDYDIRNLFRYVHLTLVRGPRQRLLDVDAVYVALKPYLDSLVDAGWLLDDKPKWCSYTASQIKNNDLGPAVLVRIATEGERHPLSVNYSPERD